MLLIEKQDSTQDCETLSLARDYDDVNKTLSCVQRVLATYVFRLSCVLFSVFAVHGVAKSEVLITLTTPNVASGFLHRPDQSGFADDVVGEAFRRIGYRLEVLVLPAERSLKTANEGLIDGELIRIAGIEKRYQNLVRVPEHLMNADFVVFSRSASQVTSDWSSLSGKSVGAVIGMKIVEINLPDDAYIVRVSNPEQLFRLLYQGRVDHVVYGRWIGLSLLQELDFGGLSASVKTLERAPMHIYLHRRHTALAKRLSDALLRMKRDGTYQTLVAKHLAPLGISSSEQPAQWREFVGE